VAIGTVLALDLSARLGLSPAADTQRFARHLKAVGLPAAIADIPGPRPDADTLLAAMMHDKKVQDGKLTFVLAKGIGHAFTARDVSLALVRDVVST
jgi:3-dehydroquinate synthetase